MEERVRLGIRKKKKTLNACQWCRTRKIKCTGQQPCQYCTSKELDCIFNERGKKVVITEDYLRELEGRSSSLAGQAQPAVMTGLVLESQERVVQDSAQNVIYEPEPRMMDLKSLTKSLKRQQTYLETQFIDSGRPRGAAGRNGGRDDETCHSDAIGDEYRYLGHSNSFSFSRNIRLMITKAVQGPELHDMIPIKDGAYGSPWQRVHVDLSGVHLPSEDYAVYLTHTVSFALRPLYHLFDNGAFLSRLHQFYTDRNQNSVQPTGIWHIQMLVIFAFGVSILAREAGPLGPTGATYFAKAVEALPDCHQLSQEPVLAIEILSLFALFMQAMDMQLAAHQYIGLAMRISITHGMERKWDTLRNTREEFEHRSRLWWSVYVIDRKLSSLIGVVPGFSDTDISLPMPDTDNIHHDEDLALGLHVEVMSQLGHILNVIYGHGSQRYLGSKFIAAVQSVLQKQVKTSRKLNTKMKIEPNSPGDTVSRTAANLYLLHHQCSILAIRPVIYFLLKANLADQNSTLRLSGAVIGLVRICAESAIRILTIIESLRIHKLLNTMLPHDIDAVFAAAFILIIIDTIAPSISEPWDLGNVLSLLDEFVTRGIIIARPYKQDLVEVMNFCEKLKTVDRRVNGLSEPQTHGKPPGPDHAEASSPLRRTEKFQETHQDQFPTHVASSSRVTTDWDPGLLDPETIESAIERLEFDILQDASLPGLENTNWMW
ncbi:uncharacterized protein N7483_009921 [Penicillium malachiteum]|uniref:uncharacterized protein n=1 Tax=Penicillium malachiteum TaxID=1324776 RepID=UPI00254688B0|nr:uncharacterized protein N7483_009921 [Penicillium malachiteum]KAJ5718839.1 hypothetical protein N7483_009921 [Penicillium malachiteum]